MVGEAVNPTAPVSGTKSTNALQASYVNSFRISAVADRLAGHVRSRELSDSVEFFNLCLSLSSMPKSPISRRAPKLAIPTTERELDGEAAKMANPVSNHMNVLSESYVNSIHIAAVADRLALLVRSSEKNYGVEFYNLCLSLARGIDYAIANSEVPNRSGELPILLKQVCLHTNDLLLRAAVVVLMISVTNACENGWFSHKDSEDLKSLADEIGSAFCTTNSIKGDANNLPPVISGIMSRFYPKIKMGQILGFLNVEPGYGAHWLRFQILKSVNCSPEERIRLFVAQTDNTETSSCIVSPQQVSFLLNGKAVDRRTNILMDTGPQLPTNVTRLLKYGSNLLQAVGQFNGYYAIIIAYMRVDETPVHPCLPDYVQPAVAALDLDSDIIEGPSRISLNCPISFRRIKTPVKGHSCKHLQCFDFDNYVDINSRRPSWRCPHCNQSVCYPDIRIDQQIVKILEEVGENVADVIISADGSWKAASEINDKKDTRRDCNPVLVSQQESVSIANSPSEILDLTEGDYVTPEVIAFENEDIKPFLVNDQCQSNNNLTTDPNITTNCLLNQNPPSHIEDDFWSGICLSMYGQGTSNANLAAQNSGDVSEFAPTNHTIPPVLTDATSPALYQENEAFCTTALATSVVQNLVAPPSSTSIQQFGNGNMINEYGRSPSITRNIHRTPVAVQALPAQTPATVTQQRTRMAPQPSPTLVLPDSSSPGLDNMERQQQSRSHLNSLQGSYMSSSLQHHIGNWGPHGHLFNSSQPSQHMNGLPAQQNHVPPAVGEHPSGYRVSPTLATDGQNSHRNQVMRQRIPPHLRTQPAILNRSSAQFPPSQTHQGGAHTRVGPSPVVGNQQDQHLAAAHRPSKLARVQSPPPSVRVQTPRTSSSVPMNVDGYRLSGSNIPRPDGMVNSSALEQDWRPSGVMRGSLSGQAYSAALNQYISLPPQPLPAARSLASLPATSSPAVPPVRPLHVLMANSRNSLSGQPGTAGNSGAFQEQPRGML